ncbi:MAG TPA: hypothetical protein VEH26_04275 [Chthoniobacterales bacterium]|nr:hypothetical protein [Chthoniobacterales bacterium]
MKTLLWPVLLVALFVSSFIPVTASAYYYHGRYYRYYNRGYYYRYYAGGRYYLHRRWVIVVGRPGYYRYW